MGKRKWQVTNEHTLSTSPNPNVSTWFNLNTYFDSDRKPTMNTWFAFLTLDKNTNNSWKECLLDSSHNFTDVHAPDFLQSALDFLIDFQQGNKNWPIILTMLQENPAWPCSFMIIHMQSNEHTNMFKHVSDSIYHKLEGRPITYIYYSPN